MSTRATTLAAILPLISLLMTGCAHQAPEQQTALDLTHPPSAPVPAPRSEIYEPPPATVPDPIRLRTGRYTYLAAKPRPEQINPLLTLINVHIPEELSTVSEAVNYLLQFSGYQLKPTLPFETRPNRLLDRRIPEVHRHFEQVILRDALLALCGHGYRLRVDPVNRLVGYEHDPKFSEGTAP